MPAEITQLRVTVQMAATSMTAAPNFTIELARAGVTAPLHMPQLAYGKDNKTLAITIAWLSDGQRLGDNAWLSGRLSVASANLPPGGVINVTGFKVLFLAAASSSAVEGASQLSPNTIASVTRFVPPFDVQAGEALTLPFASAGAAGCLQACLQSQPQGCAGFVYGLPPTYGGDASNTSSSLGLCTLSSKVTMNWRRTTVVPASEAASIPQYFGFQRSATVAQAMVAAQQPDQGLPTWWTPLQHTLLQPLPSSSSSSGGGGFSLIAQQLQAVRLQMVAVLSSPHMDFSASQCLAAVSVQVRLCFLNASATTSTSTTTGITNSHSIQRFSQGLHCLRTFRSVSATSLMRFSWSQLAAVRSVPALVLEAVGTSSWTAPVIDSVLHARPAYLAIELLNSMPQTSTSCTVAVASAAFSMGSSANTGPLQTAVSMTSLGSHMPAAVVRLIPAAQYQLLHSSTFQSLGCGVSSTGAAQNTSIPSQQYHDFGLLGGTLWLTFAPQVPFGSQLRRSQLRLQAWIDANATSFSLLLQVSLRSALDSLWTAPPGTVQSANIILADNAVENSTVVLDLTDLVLPLFGGLQTSSNTMTVGISSNSSNFRPPCTEQQQWAQLQLELNPDGINAVANSSGMAIVADPSAELRAWNCRSALSANSSGLGSSLGSTSNGSSSAVGSSTSASPFTTTADIFQPTENQICEAQILTAPDLRLQAQYDIYTAAATPPSTELASDTVRQACAGRSNVNVCQQEWRCSWQPCDAEAACGTFATASTCTTDSRCQWSTSPLPACLAKAEACPAPG